VLRFNDQPLLDDPVDREFYLSADLYSYNPYSQLILDAEPGMGGGFFLESLVGVYFTISSKIIESD